MRIVQVIDSLNWGGAQKMQIFLAETLIPLGIDVTVVSLRQSSNSSVPDELRKIDARVETFAFTHLLSPGPFTRLVKFLRRERFDLIHAHLVYANIIGSLAGQLSGTPAIASLRNAGADPRYFRPRRQKLEAFVLRHVATRVMANGYAVAKEGHKRLGNDFTIDVLPNAIDLIPRLSNDRRQAIRTQVMNDPDRTLVFSVGRLSIPKGFPDLLQAFANLHERYPAAALVIAGGGEMLNELKQLIQSFNLNGHVFLLGVRNDVQQLLGAADVYVNSSHWEGLPVSVLEAMAAGLPVVATTVGDIPNVVVPGTGLLVPPNDPPALTQALNTLLESADLRRQLGQSAREHIQNHYNREVWCQNLLELYSKVTPLASAYLAKPNAAPQAS